MQRTEAHRGGFSLMEVTTALGIVSFALVALLGIFPLGLENSRLCISETRTSQLIDMVISTVRSEAAAANTSASSSSSGTSKVGFQAVSCFASDSSTLNLTQEESWPHPGDTAPGGGAAGGATKAIVLYVSYDGQQEPQIVRAATPPTNGIYAYKIEVRFRTEKATMAAPTSGNSSATAQVVEGSTMLLRLTDLKGYTGVDWSNLWLKDDKHTYNYKRGLVFEAQAYVPNFVRQAFVQ